MKGIPNWCMICLECGCSRRPWLVCSRSALWKSQKLEACDPTLMLPKQLWSQQATVKPHLAQPVLGIAYCCFTSNVVCSARWIVNSNHRLIHVGHFVWGEAVANSQAVHSRTETSFTFGEMIGGLLAVVRHLTLRDAKPAFPPFYVLRGCCEVSKFQAVRYFQCLFSQEPVADGMTYASFMSKNSKRVSSSFALNTGAPMLSLRWACHFPK